MNNLKMNILKKEDFFLFRNEKNDNGEIITRKYIEFSPGYYISEDLKVFSKVSNRNIKINPRNLNIKYLIDGKIKNEKIQNIAARIFLKKEEGKDFIIFKDGDSKNRHISNLIWSEKKVITSYDVLPKNIKIIEKVLIDNEYIEKEVELRMTEIKGYYVSEYSNVYSAKQGGVNKIKTYKRSSGIEYIKSEKYIDTNYLTMKTFYPDNEELKFILYKDGNINNKHYTNLIWSNNPESEEEFNKFEIYKGFSNYKFSKDGICKSYFKKEPKIIRPVKDDDGYFGFTIKGDDGKNHSLRRSRVVAEIYIENPDNLPHVDHINRKKWDDRTENLRWVSNSENGKNRVFDTSVKTKPVLQFDLQGNLLNKFKNSREASAFLLEKKDVDISSKKLERNILKNKNILNIEDNYEFYGYIWRYLYYEKEKYIFQKDEIEKELCGDFGDKNIDFPNYKITNLGNIINKKGNKLNHVFINGYRCINLLKNGKTKSLRMHVWVGLFFISGRTAEKCLVNHKDEDKKNCHYKNLEWVTPSENVLHSSYKTMKAVNQYSKDGDFIRSFLSVKDASEYIGCASDSVGNICRLKEGTLYGYIWRFADKNSDNPPEKLIIEKKINKRCRAVEQYSLNGEYITTFDSIKSAAETTNGSKTTIPLCCKGINKTSGGFIWKFKDALSV